MHLNNLKAPSSKC